MKIKTTDGEEFTLEFADSFFDSFDGSPEELQTMMNELVSKIQDGTFFEESEPVSVEYLDEEEAEQIMQSLETYHRKYTLQ